MLISGAGSGEIVVDNILAVNAQPNGEVDSEYQLSKMQEGESDQHQSASQLVVVNKKGNLQLLSHAQDESSGERQIIAPQIHNNRIVGQDEETEKNGGSYFTDSV